VREIQRINERELDLAVEGAASWHDDYRGKCNSRKKLFVVQWLIRLY
jgi:hypothetical protein